ncbi:MAG: SH3 domain-containing protein [Pseudomonadota bacterium]
MPQLATSGRDHAVIRIIRHCTFVFAIMLGLAIGHVGMPTQAAAASASATAETGRETGLPLPRFVSLKARKANLRVGPGRKYAIAWRYQRAGVPLEIIQEFDRWRRVRDADGATGWVLHSLLSSRRTAIVAPWERRRSIDDLAKAPVMKATFFDAKRSATASSRTVARLQPGLQVNVRECEEKWCRVTARGVSMWVRREMLWGTYENEIIKD